MKKIVSRSRSKSIFVEEELERQRLEELAKIEEEKRMSRMAEEEKLEYLSILFI